MPIDGCVIVAIRAPTARASKGEAVDVKVAVGPLSIDLISKHGVPDRDDVNTLLWNDLSIPRLGESDH